MPSDIWLMTGGIWCCALPILLPCLPGVVLWAVDISGKPMTGWLNKDGCR